jgi:hypothetical protein
MSGSGLAAKAFVLAAKRSVPAGRRVNFFGRLGMVSAPDAADDSNHNGGDPQHSEPITLEAHTMTSAYSYQETLQLSEKSNWRVEDLIGGDKRLDFTRPFLP